MESPSATPPPASRGLGSRAARGGITVLVGQVGRIGIQLLSVVVLARLLSPTDYGLVAIVLAVVGVGEIFRDFGLSTAAVRAHDITRRQCDSLFWLNTAIGGVLALAAVACAPLVARLFDHDALVPITQVLGLTFLLNGAVAQYRAMLNRDLRFGALVMADLGSQLAGTAIAIAVALAGGGYWALVAQQLGAAGTTLLGCLVLTRWVPRLPRRGTDIREFVSFGGGLVASQVVTFLNTNVDTVTIGLRFPTSELGLYNRAYQLLMRPLSQLRTPTTSVALPVLARVREDRERFDALLVRGQLALGYSLVAGTAIAAGAAEPIIAVFLGDRWDGVAPMFALLAAAGAFQTISFVGGWVYLARGLTSDLFRYSLLSLAIKVVCVLVGSSWGIVGVAAGFALAPALAWPLSIYWLSRVTPIPVRALYAGAGRILATASLACAATYAVVRVVSPAHPWLQLLGGGAAGAATYVGLALLVPAVRTDVTQVVAAVRGGVRS
jgi:PST family polysaccharide transporter